MYELFEVFTSFMKVFNYMAFTCNISFNFTFIIILTIMGQLSIEISDSVKDILKGNNLSNALCQKSSYKCQIRTLYTISLMLMALTTSSMVYCLVQLLHGTGNVHHFTAGYQKVTHLIQEAQVVFFSVFGIAMSYYYVKAIFTLNNLTSPKLRPAIKRLQTLFTIELILAGFCFLFAIFTVTGVW